MSQRLLATITTVRDLSNGNYFVLDPDGVIQYKVESITDSTYDNFIENLKRSDNTAKVIKKDIINSPFSVYSWGTCDGMWEMGVKIPETKFRYKSTLIGDRTIYMPPVLYTVQGTTTGQYRQAFIKVITQDSISHKLMTFGELSLPNVAPGSGHICVGNSTIVGSSTDALTPAQIVAMSWDLFIGSNWNTDYIASSHFPSNLMDIADKYEVRITDHSTCIKKLRTLLTLLERSGVWEELEWNKIA